MQSSNSTVLILHGIGGHAGIHWQQWLHDQLKQRGYDVIMPTLSDGDHPDRQQWLSEIKQAVTNIDTDKLIIVGHSLGVPSALDFIEQVDSPVGALVSVSGFAVDYGLELNSYFLKEKSIDFEKVRPKLNQAIVIYGDDDPYVTQEALEQVADELRVDPIVIAGGGHLNSEQGYTTFGQLLESIVGLETISFGEFKDVVKIMANTPPISNDELVRRNRERKG